MLNFGRHAEAVLEGPGFALLDDGHGFGQTIGPEAVAAGVARAREHGFAVVGLRRSGHLGRIGGLAEIACAAVLVSIHFANVANSVFVAPFGGAAHVHGPNLHRRAAGARRPGRQGGLVHRTTRPDSG